MSRILPFLVVILALMSQLALGAVVFPDDQAELAALEAASVLCQDNHDPGDTPPAPRHAGDLCLCPLAIALALPAIILTPAPDFPEPASAVKLRPGLMAQARAPPSHGFAAAYPRGPPVPV